MWSLASGKLSGGLSLSGEDIISGTPRVHGGPIVSTVRVSDADGSSGAGNEDTQTLGVTIDPGVNGVFLSGQAAAGGSISRLESCVAESAMAPSAIAPSCWSSCAETH